MGPFGFNLLLALVWASLTGSLLATNLLIGFLLGYGLLALSMRIDPAVARYVRRLPQAIGFLAYYLEQVWRSNLRVAYDVLSPRPRIAPAIVELPLTATADGEITALANLISLTPGTLSLKVSDDRRSLFVHVMYLDDEAAAIAEMKGLEHRILELLR